MVVVDGSHIVLPGLATNTKTPAFKRNKSLWAGPRYQLRPLRWSVLYCFFCSAHFSNNFGWWMVIRHDKANGLNRFKTSIFSAVSHSFASRMLKLVHMFMVFPPAVLAQPSEPVERLRFPSRCRARQPCKRHSPLLPAGSSHHSLRVWLACPRQVLSSGSRYL